MLPYPVKRTDPSYDARFVLQSLGAWCIVQVGLNLGDTGNCSLVMLSSIWLKTGIGIHGIALGHDVEEKDVLDYYCFFPCL